MTALGQKQTSNSQPVTSALPPKADIAGRQLDVRFGPQADKVRRSNSRQPLVQVIADFRQKLVWAVRLGHKVVATSRPRL